MSDCATCVCVCVCVCLHVYFGACIFCRANRLSLVQPCLCMYQQLHTVVPAWGAHALDLFGVHVRSTCDFRACNLLCVVVLFGAIVWCASTYASRAVFCCTFVLKTCHAQCFVVSFGSLVWCAHALYMRFESLRCAVCYCVGWWSCMHFEMVFWAVFRVLTTGCPAMLKVCTV